MSSATKGRGALARSLLRCRRPLEPSTEALIGEGLHTMSSDCRGAVDTICGMRRVLAILLLALLPLQFSGAVLASYCGHEPQLGAGSLGHHEVLDLSDAMADASHDAVSDQTPGDSHLDCGHCHGHCTGVPSIWAGVSSVLSSASPRADDGAAADSVTLTPPERPQWLRLA